MTQDQSAGPVRKSPWHIYPPGWKEHYWLVPFSGDNAVIHHGHSNPEDHSLCGPTLFCCTKSQQLFVESFPDSDEAKATWEITDAVHVAAWLDSGVNVLYFIFCDPVRPNGLLAGGLTGEEARRALYKEVPLEQFTNRASRLI